jgi:hypothetical protein
VSRYSLYYLHHWYKSTNTHAEGAAIGGVCLGTPFTTCVTGTTVQILTKKALLDGAKLADVSGVLRQRKYKSTNTDAEGGTQVLILARKRW